MAEAVNTTPDRLQAAKAAASDPKWLFEELTKRIKTSPRSDCQLRITAHIREKTGHTNIVSFHNNGATKEEKVEIYQECIKAIIMNDFSALSGSIPAGQAPLPKPVEVEEPEPKPAQPLDVVPRATTPTEPEKPAVKSAQPNPNPAPKQESKSAIIQLKDFASRHQSLRSRRDSALDQSGIGHDVETRFNQGMEVIQEFTTDVGNRLARQFFYDLMTNVPCGIVSTSNATGRAAIFRALPGVIGKLVKWDISQARLMAAAILEDVNDHDLAAQIRECANNP